MNEPIPYFDVSCPACAWSELCGPEAVARRLSAARKLKRNSELSLAMLGELFLAAAARLPCPECAHVGLVVRRATDLDTGWPGPRPCTACGNPIPEERLELYPGATLCAGCQGKIDRGEPVGQGDYCPRCGWPMQLRLARSGGLARYELVCSKVPPCRLRGPT